MTIEKMADQMIERYHLSDEEAKVFLRRIQSELESIDKDHKVSTMRNWAIQIRNGELFNYDRLIRMIEHLISRRDIEGLTILIPGLSREVAQKYVNDDVKDYQMRAARLSQPNFNPGDNEDLERSHYERMKELLTGTFEKTKDERKRLGM